MTYKQPHADYIKGGRTFWQFAVFYFENVDLVSSCAAYVDCSFVCKLVDRENKTL